MKLREISARAAGLGEGIGLLGLYLSQQVESPALALPLVGFLASSLLRVRLPARWLLALVAFTAATLGYAAFASGAGNTVMLTRALLATHAFLWCAEDPGAFRFYRLSLAFLQVVLASILAPESYMLGLIFLFAILSSLSLSFGYIERQYARLKLTNLESPVPRAFLAALTAIATLVFLSSLAIFPVLPRSNWAGRALSQTGYTELVGFRSSTLGWAGENGRPLLWIFQRDEKPWPTVIPRGLLRAKVLESFDGVEWRPAVKHLGLSAETSSEALSPLEIFREPLATEVLPAPYGTAGVETEGEPRERYESGEFAYPGSQAKRVAYRLLRGSGYGLPKADLPRDVHLRKPSPARFPRLRVLARELAQGANTAAEKVNRVTQYLATGFRAEQAAVGSAEEATHPVERFLFETKAGHCELFSTAAALLLREMGVPTRLVAGFRVPLPEEGRVLTVRASHAHAWVEVYTKTGGWQPVDPTPRTLSLSSMPTFLTDAYDELNAYWHRYILGYEFDPAMLKAKAKEAIPRFAEAAGALLLILFAMACRKLWRWLRRPRVPRAEVARAFAKAPRSSSPEFELLQARYEELRFGALEPTPAVVKEFRRAVKAYRRRGA